MSNLRYDRAVGAIFDSGASWDKIPWKTSALYR